jgi:hypothetical protein
MSDLATFPDFAAAIGKSPRVVQRMVSEGLPITKIGQTPHVIISKAKDWILRQQTERHAPPRRGRPPGKRAA